MQKYFYIYENKYICTYIGEYKNKIMTAIAILIYDCALSSLLATIKSVSVKFDFETMEIHWINNPHLTSNTQSKDQMCINFEDGSALYRIEC